MVAPQNSTANPEDGMVVDGAATIVTQIKQVDVHQTSERAIIDWRSFDIAPDETTNFHQPSNNSFTLNRIRNGMPTSISGRLTANGNIAVINPNGVLIQRGATIDVNSLVTSSADTRNEDFMAGGPLKLSIPGKPDAQIINRGTITAKEAGLVGLVGPYVENDGVIRARLGKVNLASGSTAVLDMAGDGLISVAVDMNVAHQLVRNSGTIEADGGVINLTAADAMHTVQQLVSNSGKIQANSIQAKGGTIVIKGNGTTEQKGTVFAKGENTGEKGGNIRILGDKVLLGANSKTDASGKAGGGEVLVGGDFQGTQDRNVRTASAAAVEAGATVDVSATENGNGGKAIVWADDYTNFKGSIAAKGGDTGGDGGLVEVSGKQRLNYAGIVNTLAKIGKVGTLLLDPTDIVISTGGNNNVTGASPFEPTVDDGPSVLNITTLQNALGLSNVTVQTRATGAQPGNITISNALTWVADNMLTLDAHNNVIVNAAITGPQVHFIARDVNIAANLSDNGSSNGSLWFDLKNTADTIGLAGGAGTYNLAAADLNFIQDGYENLTFGNTSGTGGINLNARTWNDNLTLLSSTGNINIAGTQTMGANDLTLTGRTMNIGGALNGAGTLTIAPDIDESIGMGTAAAGTLHFTNTEMANLDNTWTQIFIGNTGTAGIKTYNYTTAFNDPLTIRSGTGLIDIANNLAIGGNALGLIGRDITIGGTLTGTSTLTIAPDTDVDIGFGDGAVGTLHFSDAEIANMDNTFSNIIIGDLGTTAAKNINYSGTMVDPLQIQSGTGIIDVQGALATGGNNLALIGRDINVGAQLTGTGTLTMRPDTDVDIGIGDGAAGVLTFTNAELNNATATWGNIVIGQTGTTGIKTANTFTWADPLQIHSGTGLIDIVGQQDMGGNGIALLGRNVNIGAAITGTGAVTIRPDANATVGIGDGAAGTFHLSNAELAFLGTAHSSQNFGLTGNTQAMTINAYTWGDDVVFNSGTGLITVAGAQVLGGNDFALIGRNITIGNTVTGTGTFTARPDANATVGIGSGTGGTFNLDDTELGNLGTTWGALAFGLAGNTSTTTVATRTWSDPVTINGGTGLMSVAAQTMGANNLTLNGRNMNITGALSGTGTLTVTPDANATVGIGDGTGGTFNLSNAELDFFGSSWGSVVLGFSGNTSTTTVAGRTWNDPLTIRGGTGLTDIQGDLIMGSNNLTLSARNLTIGASLIGTGALTLQPDTNATVGIGSGAGGTFNLDDTEIAFFLTNGWNQFNFGNTGSSGAMNVLARNWDNNVSFRTGSGAITIAGAQEVGAHNLNLQGGGMNINDVLTGTGNLTIQQDTNRTMGIGDGATGTVNLNNTELTNLSDGWNLINFGNTGSDQAIDIQAYTWLDNVNFRSATGIINVNGAQDAGANNMTFTTRALNIAEALTGTGTLTIQPDANNRSIGVGTGAAGNLQVDATELDHITDGWTNLIFGRADSTVGLDIHAYTWRDNVTFQSSTGTISVGQAQDFGANNATFITRALTIGATLSGTGDLAFQQDAANQTIGVGTSAGGSLNLTGAELDFLQDGFNLITFGRNDGTAAFDLRAYANWKDNVQFRSDTGVITVNGAQNFAANNATFRSSADLLLNNNLTGTGALAFENQQDGTTWGLAGGAGTQNFSVAELNRIQNGFSDIRFGRAGATGAMTVNAYAWNDPFTFQTTGGITLAGAQTAVAGSDVSAAILGSSTIGSNSLDFSNTLAGNGGITLGAGTHSITGDLISNGGNITVNGTLTMGGAAAAQRTIDAKTGTITVGATGSVNVTDKRLDLIADDMAIAGNLTGADRLRILTSTPTRAMSIGAGAAGAGLNFDDTEIAQLGGGFTDVIFGDYAQARAMELRNATFANRVQFLTADDITLAGVINATAVGNSMVLASGGDLINNHGAGALVSAGRHLVYSTSPEDDTLNGIARPTRRYGRTYTGNAPSGITETGSVFMYSVTPTLTLTAVDTTREAGQVNPAFTFNHTGLLTDDVIGDALSGTANIASMANGASPVGTYPIVMAAGTLISPMGYSLSFADGTLTVTPATATPANNVPSSVIYVGNNPGVQSSLLLSFMNNQDSGFSIGTPGLTQQGDLIFNNKPEFDEDSPLDLELNSEMETRTYRYNYEELSMEGSCAGQSADEECAQGASQ